MISARSIGLEPLAVLATVSACGMAPDPDTPAAVELPSSYRMLFMGSTWGFRGHAVIELVHAPSCAEDRAACETSGGSCPMDEDHATTDDVGVSDAEAVGVCAARKSVDIVCSSRDARVLGRAMLVNLICESESDIMAGLLPSKHLLGTPTGLYDARHDLTSPIEDTLWMRARPERLARSWSATDPEPRMFGSFSIEPCGEGWSVEESTHGPGRRADGWILHHGNDLGITGGSAWSFDGVERIDVSWGMTPR